MIWTYITISVSDIKKASFVHVHVLTVCYSRRYRYLSYMIWCFACNVYQISVFIKNILGIPNIYNRLYSAVCLTHGEGNEFFFYTHLFIN